MARWHTQLRMIERRPFVAHAVIGERLHESDQRCLVAISELETGHARSEATVRKVAMPVIEVDQLFQSRLAAVVQIRTSELDVAEPRHLEGSHCQRLGSEKRYPEAIGEPESDVV